MSEDLSYTNYFSSNHKKDNSTNLSNHDAMTIERRLKLLEERHENLSKRIQMLEQNSISHFKRIKTQMSEFEEDLKKFKNKINDMSDSIKLMIEQFRSFAKKGDVVEIKKYIELMNPLNYVNEKEVNEIIDKKLESLKLRKSSKND